MTHFSQADLEAYLDEALPPEDMAAVEDALRNHPELAEQLMMIHSRRDAGVHTLGEIWRRHRLTCPTRTQLTMFLDRRLDADESDYVQFHLEEVKCRLCSASFEDIQIQREAIDLESTGRHQRLLERSSNYFKKP